MREGGCPVFEGKTSSKTARIGIRQAVALQTQESADEADGMGGRSTALFRPGE